MVTVRDVHRVFTGANPRARGAAKGHQALYALEIWPSEIPHDLIEPRFDHDLVGTLLCLCTQCTHWCHVRIKNLKLDCTFKRVRSVDVCYQSVIRIGALVWQIGPTRTHPITVQE